MLWKMEPFLNSRSLAVTAFLIFNLFLSVINGQNNPVFSTVSADILEYESISEGLVVDDCIGDIIATDQDGDTLTYGIEVAAPQYLSSGRGDASEFLRVDSSNNRGQVYVTKTFDREQYNELAAAWTVHDGTVLIVRTPPVVMFVTDINDNHPYFENLPTRLEPSLQENTTVGSVVLTITMDDVDADVNGRVDANLVEVTNVFCELDAFSVEEIATNVYQLKLAEELNYDLQSEYTVCLQATDRGSSSLSSDVSRVIIPIEDVQNLPPIFLNQPYDKSIPEDLAVGEFVIRVTAQDGDRGVPLPNAIIYEMDSEKFEINSTTGDVTVKASLNREDVAQYTLVVNATEQATTGSTQPESQIKQQTDIFITISDVDDNMPEFDTTLATATVAENAAVNSALNMELNVVDEDSPENADIILSLSQPFDVFKLQTNTFTSSGRVDVRVMDSSYLDYEMRDEIIFQVIATSGSFESTANVTVTITDENDNTPNFTKSEYTGSFKEDVSSGEFILDVQADDADGDTLVYSTSAAEFDVDPSSGRITTAVDDFDAEIRTQYTFTVIASDGRGRSSAVLVNLECTDVNDRAPEFQRSELQLYEDEFDSLTEPENVIGNVLAIDLDSSPPNNVITYSIDSGNDQDKFRIDNVTGDIYFAAPVDYEMDQTFTLIILAEDNGTPSLNDTATVTVNIVDINDNDPVFQQPSYSFDIGEDAINGAIVGQVKATDEDSSYNGEVDYFIRSGSLDDFFITKDGNISVSGNLDRDRVANYSLGIVASDRGTPLREDTCEVTITVTDVNDKPPSFDPDFYVGSVNEDANSGFVILTVSAIDTDADSNLIFSIESINPNVTDQFNIGETSGIITVGKELDYETYQSFQLLVKVEDINTVSGVDWDTATVTINIGDVNDNSPAFENVPYDFSVEEESTSGTVISTDVSAVDADEGINADIKYRLQDDAEGKLRIDEVTGTLVVIDRIDREDIGDLLTIVIIAEDGGLPTRNATIQANIKIIDINDNTPKFNGSLCADIEVSEGVVEGTETGCKVSATDQDSVWGEITYSIQGGNTLQWFQINNKTGEITVGPVSPDREVADEVILNINAADPGSRTATQDVTITILDVNDEAPEFTVFSNDIVTTESTRADITLTTVVAEDGDKANTNASTVRYEIIAGNDEGLFKLDDETGKLDTKESLQTAAGTYTLSIRAYDLGSPQMRSDPRDMTITVQDINDNTPIFVFPNPDPDNITIVNIREGPADVNTTLFVASATDNDIGDNGEIIYRFVEVTGGSEDWSNFKVDEISGKVSYISDPPDWYIQSVFKLTLEALNYKSVTELSALVNFEVHVLDIIDTPPYFWNPNEEGSEPAETELSIIENNQGEVGRIDLATERDDSQDVYYYIVDGNEDGLFSINKTTGVIFANKVLSNNDGNNLYELIIKATNDSNFEPESRRRRAATAAYNPALDPSLLTVIITVIDINDNPPIFTQDLYTAGVLYTVDFDVSVLRVSVTDLDTDEGNTRVGFYIESQRRITPGSPEDPVMDNAFAIDNVTGIVTTQDSFLSLVDGIYFEMEVSAKDLDKSTGYSDTTNVFISIITESKQLKVHLWDDSNSVRSTSSELESLFETIILAYDNDTNDFSKGVSVDFDKIATFTKDDTPLPDESEILFHVVELKNYTILDADFVLDVLDHSPKYIDTVKDSYSVDYIVLASPLKEAIDFTVFQWLVLVLAIVFLLLLLLVLLAFYFSKKQHERILRAYGIKNAYQIPEEVGRLPNTNTYASSNPVFNNDTYEGALDDEPEPEVKVDSTSMASEEAVMDMENDEADYYQIDDMGGNMNALNTMLDEHDREAEQYAHKIHLPGLEVTEV